MSDLEDNIQIVGMDGDIEAPCDLVLPIIQNTITLKYARWNSDDLDALTWLNKTEIEFYIKDGSITLFDRDYPKIDMKLDTSVIYVNDFLIRQISGYRMLNYVTSIRNSYAELQLDEKIVWHELVKQNSPSQYWYAFGSESTLVSILNIWAEKLKNLSAMFIQAFLKQGSDKDLKVAAERCETALFAAQSRTLKEYIYLYLGVIRFMSDNDEEILSFYDMRVSLLYPEWDWDSFLDNVLKMKQIFTIKSQSKGVLNSNMLASEWDYNTEESTSRSSLHKADFLLSNLGNIGGELGKFHLSNGKLSQELNRIDIMELPSQYDLKLQQYKKLVSDELNWSHFRQNDLAEIKPSKKNDQWLVNERVGLLMKIELDLVAQAAQAKCLKRLDEGYEMNRNALIISINDTGSSSNFLDRKYSVCRLVMERTGHLRQEILADSNRI